MSRQTRIRRLVLISALAPFGAHVMPARAVRVWLDGGKVWLELDDGREIGFPPDKYRRLRDASDEQLSKVRIEARGRALRWEELDEDLSIDGLLAGRWLT